MAPSWPTSVEPSTTDFGRDEIEEHESGFEKSDDEQDNQLLSFSQTLVSSTYIWKLALSEMIGSLVSVGLNRGS